MGMGSIGCGTISDSVSKGFLVYLYFPYLVSPTITYFFASSHHVLVDIIQLVVGFWSVVVDDGMATVSVGVGCSTSTHVSLIYSLASSTAVSLISTTAPAAVVRIIVIIIIVVPELPPLMPPTSPVITVVAILVVGLNHLCMGLYELGSHCVHGRDHGL